MKQKSYPLLLEGSHEVSTHEANYLKEMKISSLLDFFQDIATQHADLLDYGYFDLLEKNQFWILSRIRIEITSIPLWKDSLNYKTWTNGLNGLFPLRNWQIFKENTLSIAGHAEWLILDAKTHRPIRPNASDFVGRTLPEQATEKIPERLKPQKDLQEIRQFEVRISDLDMNQHVNNVQYYMWINDSLSMEFLIENKIASIDICYLKEIKYPNTVKVYCNENNTFFQIASENGGQVHCCLKIKWEIR